MKVEATIMGSALPIKNKKIVMIGITIMSVTKFRYSDQDFGA
jgi:hypothetical protein